MLPPIDDAVLAENPDFAAVYKKITTVLLNPDASTRRSPDVNNRHAVREVSDPVLHKKHSCWHRYYTRPVPSLQ